MAKPTLFDEKFLGDTETLLALEIQTVAKSISKLVAICKNPSVVDDFKYIDKKNLALLVNRMHEDTLRFARELRNLKKKSRLTSVEPDTTGAQQVSADGGAG